MDEKIFDECRLRCSFVLCKEHFRDSSETISVEEVKFILQRIGRRSYRATVREAALRVRVGF